MNLSFYDWYKGGFTSIPNHLFNHYYELNLTSDEMVFIIYLLTQISQGHSVEDIQRISDQLGWNRNKVLTIISKLIDKNYLAIELIENRYGKKTDHYTLRPLFDTISKESESTESNTQTEVPEKNKSRNILQIFEDEFGRPLSNIEIEYVNNWLVKDQLSEDLIILALQQAVLNNAYSLKYIERILFNWQKQNIRTVQAARSEIEQFESKRNPNSSAQKNTQEYDHLEIPMNYWNNKQ